MNRERKFSWVYLAVMMALAVIVHLYAQPSGAAEDATQNIESQFQYNSTAPFNLKEMSVKRGEVIVRDITFEAGGATIKAYLVSPSGNGPFAGILYVHWLGDPPSTNRTEFLNEATALAPQGVVSLLVDTMWAEPGWYEKRVPEKDYANSIRQVIQLRRSLDLLLSQPGIDPKRIAFVGHDFGAMYGVVMGAVDPRPMTYVLMAGTPSFVDWYLYAKQPADLEGYKKQMTPLSPIEFVEKIKNASLFFQFSDSDEFVPDEKALAFYKAAHARKQMATYHTDHSLVGKDVDADRQNWLIRELGLKR